MRSRRSYPIPVVPGSAFKGFRFPPEIIVLALRWYLRYGLSYRGVEERLAERGIEVDHVTVYRWVQRFTPLLADAAGPCRHAFGDRWFPDATRDGPRFVSHVPAQACPFLEHDMKIPTVDNWRFSPPDLADVTRRLRANAEAREAATAEFTRAAQLGEHDDGQREHALRLSRQIDKLLGEHGRLEAERDAIIEQHDGQIEGLKSAAREGRLSGSPGVGEPTRTRRSDPWSERTVPVAALGEAERRDRSEAALARAGDDADVSKDAIERFGRALDRDDRGEVAEWAVTSADPAYRSAFSKVLRDAQSAHLKFTDAEAHAFRRANESRAALSLTGANGGFLVPFTLDPSVVITSAGTTNPFREIARQVTITTDDWNGVSSAGITAEWLSEGSEVADASPTFAQPSITVHKAAAYVQASYEVWMDAANLEDELARLFRDAKDNLEATAHATGSGSGQPYGIVTELNQGSAPSRIAGSSGAADLVVADIYAMKNSLPARHRPNSAWVAEGSTWNVVRQFATGSGPQSAFWADLGVATPATLLGRPTYESSAMDSTRVSGSN
ncbi:MAG: phage major capsid protein [Actinobacteria bacterium]|nr:phage major capsid protein [Actinomycetota bacterium]